MKTAKTFSLNFFGINLIAGTPSSRSSRQNIIDGNLSASSPSLANFGAQSGGQKVKFVEEVIVDPRDSKRQGCKNNVKNYELKSFKNKFLFINLKSCWEKG